MNSEILNFLESYSRYNEIHVKNLLRKVENEVEFNSGAYIQDLRKEDFWMHRLANDYNILKHYKKVALDSVMKTSAPDLILNMLLGKNNDRED